MKPNLQYLVLVVAVVVSSWSTAVKADGIDMWSGEMPKNLFQPHKNNCDGTSEVFVAMGRNGTGGAYGFCIEKNQRTAAYYDNARQTCVGLGKRLAEPVEWVFACENYSGSLNNMTDDFEWVGNLTTSQSTSGTNNLQGVSATALGNGGCHVGGMGVIADFVLSVQSFTFRCVY